MIEALLKASEKKNLQSVVMGHFHFKLMLQNNLLFFRMQNYPPSYWKILMKITLMNTSLSWPKIQLISQFIRKEYFY